MNAPQQLAAAQKPRIIFVVYANPDHYPPTWNAVLELRADFEVRLLGRRSGPAMVAWPADVIVERIGAAESSAGNSLAAKALEYARYCAVVRRRLQLWHPSVVYACEPHGYTAALLGRRSGVPLFYHHHELTLPPERWTRSLGMLVANIAARTAHRATEVVFPDAGRAALYTARVRLPRPPIIVPNFPRAEAFPPLRDWDALLAARWNRREIFYRGALGDDNGTIVAVQAVALTRAPVAFAACGFAAPEFLARMDAVAAAAGVAGRVRYEGFVPSYDALNERTRQSSLGLVLYLGTTANYQFAVTATNKLYEYLACGLPVVVPDRPDYREFLGEAPWVEYADPASPAAVAAAVDRILADRGAYEQRCRAARAAFETRFCFDRAFAPLRARLRAAAGLAPQGGEGTACAS